MLYFWFFDFHVLIIIKGYPFDEYLTVQIQNKNSIKPLKVILKFKSALFKLSWGPMCVRGVKDWPETKVQWSRKDIAAYYTAASLWAWGWHHIARCVRCLTGTQPVVSANPNHRMQNTETKERIYLTSNETRFICFSFPFSEITLFYDLLNITLQITTSISFTSYLLSHILILIWIPAFNLSHTSMNQS